MNRLSVSRPARRDLKEILVYVARDKPVAARRLRSALEGVFRVLATNPSIGEARPDLGRGIRVFSFGSYAVYFRKTRASVVIARVIHGARDVTGL
ncbi:MAG: type II toxin-antitoxin system RelE/ParE family toxin [Thermoguttaceae bacterium]|jgi:toxin ParE1/3/4